MVLTFGTELSAVVSRLVLPVPMSALVAAIFVENFRGSPVAIAVLSDPGFTMRTWIEQVYAGTLYYVRLSEVPLS